MLTVLPSWPASSRSVGILAQVLVDQVPCARSSLTSLFATANLVTVATPTSAAPSLNSPSLDQVSYLQKDLCYIFRNILVNHEIQKDVGDDYIV
jgi:hypothetical protein